MLRYTTIHHDVRERFGLTISEYMVADSTHKLSYESDCTQSAEQMAEWVGVSVRSVEGARIKLIKSGLMKRTSSGYRMSKEWDDAVVYAQRGDTPQKLRTDSAKIADTYYIQKENKKNLSSDELSELDSSEDDDIQVVPEEETQRRTFGGGRRDTSYRKLYHLWDTYYGGKYPSWWNVNPHVKEAAERLLKEKGMEKCSRAVIFWLQHKDEPFCPKLSTPQELEQKWQAGVDFKNRDRR